MVQHQGRGTVVITDDMALVSRLQWENVSDGLSAAKRSGTHGPKGRDAGGQPWLRGSEVKRKETDTLWSRMLRDTRIFGNDYMKSAKHYGHSFSNGSYFIDLQFNL
ncbi:hypothetical protein SRHO_G00270110 [Serrasalmus rhombeus]